MIIFFGGLLPPVGGLLWMECHHTGRWKVTVPRNVVPVEDLQGRTERWIFVNGVRSFPTTYIM